MWFAQRLQVHNSLVFQCFHFFEIRFATPAVTHPNIWSFLISVFESVAKNVHCCYNTEARNLQSGLFQQLSKLALFLVFFRYWTPLHTWIFFIALVFDPVCFFIKLDIFPFIFSKFSLFLTLLVHFSHW